MDISSANSESQPTRPLFEQLEQRLLLNAGLSGGSNGSEEFVAPLGPEPKRVIIDMDPSFGNTPEERDPIFGVCDPDDVLALIYAAQSPNCHLEGITVGWGNMWDTFYPGIGTQLPPAIETYYSEAQEATNILRDAGILDYYVPIAKGASYLETWRVLGIDPTIAHLTPSLLLFQPQATGASEFIEQLVSEYPDQITIIAQGTLTNLATAMYYYDGGPGAFLEDVAEIWITGGAVEQWHEVCMPGNVPLTAMTAEYNIWRDAQAAEYVFASVGSEGSEGKVRMVPLDATMDKAIEDADWDEVRNADTSIGLYVAETVSDWMRRPLLPGLPPLNKMWPYDTVGVAIALEPELTADAQYAPLETGIWINAPFRLPSPVPWPGESAMFGQTVAWPLRGSVTVYQDFDVATFADRFIARMKAEPPSPPQESPDYTIASVSPNGPDHPLPGLLSPDSQFHVFVTTRNQGIGDAPGYPGATPVSETKIYLSTDAEVTGSGNDIYLGSQEVAPLAAGGTESDYVLVSLAGKGISPGTYYIGAIADATGVVDEGSDEANNAPDATQAVMIQDEPAATLLSNGYVTPTTGIETTDFEYYVTYTHPGGEAPKRVFVTIDDGYWTGLMHQVAGDPVAGAVYKCSLAQKGFALSEGSHTYTFGVRLYDDTVVEYPDSGVLYGPFVGEAQAMQVALLPREQYEVGEEVWLDIEIKDPSGNWYDPDGQYPVQVVRMPGEVWYGYLSMDHTGVGRYSLSVGSLAEGYTTYTCLVESTVYADTAVSIQMQRGDVPEQDPVQITDINVDPPSVLPGATTVNISYFLSRDAKNTVRILDGNADVVRTIIDHEDRVRGTQVVQWDGRNDQGQYVSDDLYQVSIEAIDVHNIQNIYCYGPEGRGYGFLKQPRGIWAQDGKVYVVDYRAVYPDTWKGVIFHDDSTLDKEFGGDAPDFAPQDVALDSQGNIYVISTATYNPVVRVFDNDGNYVRSFGQGTIGWDYDPCITVDSEDNVYVGSYQTVYKFSSSGSPLHSFFVPSLWEYNQQEVITGISVDAAGAIWIASDHGLVKKFDQQGNELLSFFGNVSSQAGISVRSDGLVFVKGKYELRVFDADGYFLHGTNLVGEQLMRGVHADDEGYIYVTASTSSSNWTLSTLRDLSTKTVQAVPVPVDSNPPTAVISDPVDGQTIDGHITTSLSIVGTANDPDFSHYLIEWQDDTDVGTWYLIFQDDSSVVNDVLATWDMAGIRSGSYTIRVTVYDNSGALSQNQVGVDYLDAVPPSASLLSPGDGAPLSNQVRLVAQTPDDDVLHVDFEYQVVGAGTWNLIDRDYTYPYSAWWDTTVVSFGDCLIRGTATDTAGNVDPSPTTVSVSVDNAAPSAQLVMPASGSTVSREVRLEAECADPDVAAVVFQYRPAGDPYWLNVGYNDEAPWTADWNTESLSNGQYELRAVAIDELGNIDEGPEAVTVALLILAGDVNGDGLRDDVDIDELYASFGSPASAKYDLDGDGDADDEDMGILVHDILNTEFGDLNLDGYVNGTDLAGMKVGFGQDGMGWAGGDLNGDGFVNATDLAILKANFGFEKSADGDFNRDGIVDALDIDGLFDNFGAQGWINPKYDLDGDGDADDEDMGILVHDILNTEFGDLNLDGYVNGTDLAGMKVGFGQDGMGWAGGDLNGDGFVNGTDLAILKVNFGFEASGQPLVVSSALKLAPEAMSMPDAPQPAEPVTLSMPGLSVPEAAPMLQNAPPANSLAYQQEIVFARSATSAGQLNSAALAGAGTGRLPRLTRTPPQLRDDVLRTDAIVDSLERPAWPRSIIADAATDHSVTAPRGLRFAPGGPRNGDAHPHAAPPMAGILPASVRDLSEPEDELDNILAMSSMDISLTPAIRGCFETEGSGSFRRQGRLGGSLGG